MPKNALGGGLSGVQSLGKAGNLTGSLLPMNDALGGGLVDGRSGGAQELSGGSLIFGLDGGTNGFHNILDAGLNGAITSSALHALLVTLDSRLVVGHDVPSGVRLAASETRRGCGLN